MAATEKKMVRMLVQLPVEMKRALDFIRADEGVPQAAFMRRFAFTELGRNPDPGFTPGSLPVLVPVLSLS